MSRFLKLSAGGEHMPPDALDHVAVLDTQTWLMWPASTILTPMPWAAAMDAAANTDVLGYTDWRLPTVHELFSLVDVSCFSPAIDRRVFPGAKGAWHWTASPSPSFPEHLARGIHFGSGDAYCDFQRFRGFVRPVRSAKALRVH